YFGRTEAGSTPRELRRIRGGGCGVGVVMSRAVIQESFGGAEVLEVRDVAEPHAGPGEVRVRVSAAGLNPVDWKIAASPMAAERFGIALPAGFGNDYAGVVDEVGDGVTGFAAGDRVYGGARAAAVADYAVVRPGKDPLLAEPVRYGDGLADRVRALAPQGVTAAADLVGTETAQAALELGVAPGRIATIAASSPPDGVRATGGRDATPGALEHIAAAIAAGEFTVPIAATFPIEQTRAAVELQRDGHVHGK